MKQIWIMRHAKSDQKANVPDFDRPLNKRGKRDAPFMGQWMKNHDQTPELIISSPAKRAAQTAVSLGKSIGYVNEIIWWDELYPGEITTTFASIKKLPERFNRIIIIGHNPHVQELASFLISGETSLSLKLPTATVVLYRSNIETWSMLRPRATELYGVLSPKLLYPLCSPELRSF